MKKQLTGRVEYFLLASAAYADLLDSEGNEHPIGSRKDEPGDIAYEKLKDLGWRLIHSTQGRTGYRGHVFAHEERKELCVAHRGSKNLGSFITDIQAVVSESHTGHATDAIKETLGFPIVSAYFKERLSANKLSQNWTLSSTGHSLGGWLAALFQYVVSDLGMGFHFDGRIIGCGFDAPGIADFLDALQPSDASKRVNISGLDYTNFVMRTDIVNTCGKQIGTTVCLEGDKASEACAMGDILNIATIHSREEIGKALEAKNYKMMQRWPSTSSDVLDKLIVAVTGSKWRLLGLGVGLASSASSFLKRLLVGTGATLSLIHI